jgi:hypothetical protein
MTRIDTTRTHRPTDTEQREDRKDRAAEVILLAVGIVFGSLLVSAEDAYGAGPERLQLAAAPTANMSPTASASTGGLDLSMPKAAPTEETASAPTYEREDGAAVTDLDDQTSLHGLHRLEIDLYADDMRPRAGTPLR